MPPFWRTIAIGAGSHKPVNTALPAIFGTATEGQTLTTTAGLWLHSPTNYAYQWKANGSNVGTNTSSYLLTASEIGKTIMVTVTATNAFGSTPAISLATAAVASTDATFVYDTNGNQIYDINNQPITT